MAKYNGWSNYETWLVKLWIDNDYDFYQAVRAMVTLADGDVFGIADSLKALHEEMNPLNSSASVFTDLLNGALSEVNWDEIARSLIEESSAA